MTIASAQSDLAAAIAYAEGFGVPGAIPTVRNNPGDLTQSGVIATYPDSTAGYTALETQLQTIAAGRSRYYNPNMSIAQIGSIYANGDPNWASNVADYLGVSPDTPFSAVYSPGGASLAGGNGSGASNTGGASGGGVGAYLDPTGGALSTLFGSGSGTRVVTVIVGLILVAAGVFGFNRVREIVVDSGKAALAA